MIKKNKLDDKNKLNWFRANDSGNWIVIAAVTFNRFFSSMCHFIEEIIRAADLEFGKTKFIDSLSNGTFNPKERVIGAE